MKYSHSTGKIPINASGKSGNMNKFLYGKSKKRKRRK